MHTLLCSYSNKPLHIFLNIHFTKYINFTKHSKIHKTPQVWNHFYVRYVPENHIYPQISKRVIILPQTLPRRFFILFFTEVCRWSIILYIHNVQREDKENRNAILAMTMTRKRCFSSISFYNRVEENVNFLRISISENCCGSNIWIVYICGFVGRIFSECYVNGEK